MQKTPQSTRFGETKTLCNLWTEKEKKSRPLIAKRSRHICL